MSISRVPTEDNYVCWTLFGIRDYFRQRGYRVQTYSVGQVRERMLPADQIVEVGNKIVGLQFKRPMMQHKSFRWPPTPHQHEAILNSPWIYYCLPDFADYDMQDVALFHCRFVPAEALKADGTVRGRYFRWGTFADAILDCRNGLLIRDWETALSVIDKMIGQPTVAILALDVKNREARVVSPITEADNEFYDDEDANRNRMG